MSGEELKNEGTATIAASGRVGRNVRPVAIRRDYGVLEFLPGYHDLPQGTKLYAIPEGWTLVPNEPTPAMKKAGSLARHSAACDGGYAIVGGPAAESCYRAMLDASPNVPNSPERRSAASTGPVE